MDRFPCTDVWEVPITQAWGLQYLLVIGMFWEHHLVFQMVGKLWDVRLSYCFLGCFVSQVIYTKSMADQADAQILSRLAPKLGITSTGWGCSAARTGKRNSSSCSYCMEHSVFVFQAAGGREGGDSMVTWACPPCQRLDLTRQECDTPMEREGVAGELPAAPPVPWDSSQITTNNWNAVLTLCWGLFQVKLFHLKLPPPFVE